MKFHLNLISSICFQFKLKRTFERNIVQIVDGTLVPLGKYPFIVVVEKYEGGDYCVGSIYNEWTIITAHHCLDHSAMTGWRIIAGVVDKNTFFSVSFL